MKKAILIVGPPRSGKSIIARTFHQYVNYKEWDASIYIDGRSLKDITKTVTENRFITTNTCVIIIDDLPIAKVVELYLITSGKIEINKKGLKPFIIEPQIIITVMGSAENLPNDASFNARFTVIKTKGKVKS